MKAQREEVQKLADQLQSASANIPYMPYASTYAVFEPPTNVLQRVGVVAVVPPGLAALLPRRDRRAVVVAEGQLPAQRHGKRRVARRGGRPRGAGSRKGSGEDGEEAHFLFWSGLG